MIYRNRVKLEISPASLSLRPNIADFDQSMLVRVILGAQAALACAFILLCGGRYDI